MTQRAERQGAMLPGCRSRIADLRLYVLGVPENPDRVSMTAVYQPVADFFFRRAARWNGR
jgi:hypothetical protein